MGWLLGSKSTVTLAIVAVIAVSVAVIARNWSCRAQREPRSPRAIEYKVVSVPDATTLLVSYGLRDRKEASVSLFGIRVPSEVSERSTSEVRRLAGGSVYLEEAQPSKMAATAEKATAGEVEGIRPPPSLAYAYGQEDMIQLSLLRAGLAVSTTQQSRFLDAEREGMGETATTTIWASVVTLASVALIAACLYGGWLVIDRSPNGNVGKYGVFAVLAWLAACCGFASAAILVWVCEPFGVTAFGFGCALTLGGIACGIRNHCVS